MDIIFSADHLRFFLVIWSIRLERRGVGDRNDLWFGVHCLRDRR